MDRSMPIQSLRSSMYTGKTEQPCCLCGNPETVARLDLPPRAVTLMKHGGPIAWRDIVGDVSVHFCADDWELVCDLVLSVGTTPLPRCNAAHASFDLRGDFEALVNGDRDQQDNERLERRLRAESRDVIERAEAGEDVETRALVEARVITWALADAGATVDP